MLILRPPHELTADELKEISGVERKDLDEPTFAALRIIAILKNQPLDVQKSILLGICAFLEERAAKNMRDINL